MRSIENTLMHDLALIGLIVLFAGAVLGVRILWDIYKIAVGFWRDYRKVNGWTANGREDYSATGRVPHSSL
jgi:hypothetical protein